MRPGTADERAQWLGTEASDCANGRELALRHSGPVPGGALLTSSFLQAAGGLTVEKLAVACSSAGQSLTSQPNAVRHRRRLLRRAETAGGL